MPSYRLWWVCLESSIGCITFRLLLFHFKKSDLINYNSDTVTKKCAVMSLRKHCFICAGMFESPMLSQFLVL